jgi:hypothetical protein
VRTRPSSSRKLTSIDLAEHRRWVLDRFRGTLCVDELHLGRSTLLLATDPLRDLPVAFTLVASDNQGHMRRFLNPDFPDEPVVSA